MALETETYERQVATPDGSIDVVVAHPRSGLHPGVLFFTDIGGIRPGQVERIERLASEGFTVMMPNLCYRTRRPPLFDFPRNMKEERSRQRMAELVAPLTPEAFERDVHTYVEWLTARSGVTPGPIGVVGHCFSGSFAMRAAAAESDRIVVAMSFHGGGLATDKPMSPHLLLPKIRARLYFGHAVEDASMPAADIERLDQALAAWDGEYESEVWAGAHHGWTAPDSPVFNPPQAERAHSKIVEVLAQTLR
jgi:carboxymethylenebutenolidase